MKRFFTYIVLAALTALTLGCKKEDDADRKDLDSRERVPISVSYSADGAQVSSLAFPHGAMQKTIDVSVNNENLHWDVLSNRPWCKVVQAEHVGSGSVTLEIEANEGFEARDPATLTFVAGEYRGASLTVSQSGSAFVISHPYLIFPKEESPIEVDITTLANQEWRVENDEWINVEEISALTDDGKKTTTLKIWPVDNDQDSRYGTITLSTDEDRDIIALYQFGSDLMYDGEGNIFFPNDEPASISFIAPEYVVKEVVTPSFATGVGRQNSDGTMTFSIELEDNLSDCELVRDVPVSIVLNNAASTTIALPSMRQDFLPAYGLMTAVGLKAFAAKVAEGGATTSWEKDGVVRVLQDIDMDGVTDWSGVGTEEHPFTGVFDGGGYSIINFGDVDKPLFNFCSGATVKNISIAKNSSYYVAGAENIGGIANVASSTTFDHCTFSGTLKYGGRFAESHIGGIVADADGNTVVSACKMNGTITISSTTTTADGYVALVGGLVGNNLGTVMNSEMGGTINLNSGHTTVTAGGITAILKEGATVSGNAFTGAIDLKGSNKFASVGGVAGSVPAGSFTLDYASDKTACPGSVSVSKFASIAPETGVEGSRIFVGGMIGLIGEEVALTAKGYTLMTNIYLDYSTTIEGEYICAGGLLGSCEPDALSGDLSFEDITSEATVSNMFTSSAAHVRRNCVGGVAGLVNGKATFLRCINKGKLDNAPGSAANCGRSNGWTMILGGIAGQCYGADMTFDHCENRSDLGNNYYSNHFLGNTYGNFYSATSTGGIIGAFNYKQSPQAKTLTVKDCTMKGNLCAIRGFVGGIAGYAYGASFTNCSWEGNSKHLKIDKSDNQAAYKGGIAGGLGNATIDGCTAKCELDAVQYGNSPSADPGGIVGHVMSGDPVTIKNSAWFGKIATSRTTAGELVSCIGGIVGSGESNTVVQNCRFGGSISGLDITQNNLNDLAVGNYATCQCTIEGLSLWNGI